ARGVRAVLLVLLPCRGRGSRSSRRGGGSGAFRGSPLCTLAFGRGLRLHDFSNGRRQNRNPRIILIIDQLPIARDSNRRNMYHVVNPQRGYVNLDGLGDLEWQRLDLD